MLITLIQAETTRNGTLEKEKRDHAVSQWTHCVPLLRGASAQLQIPSFWPLGPGVGGRELCLVL